MGKEETFFLPAVRNAVAEVISAKSRKETVPSALGGTRLIPMAWAQHWDLAFCPKAVAPHHVPVSQGRGGGQGRGNRGTHPSPPPAAASCQLCRQMCPLPAALQLWAPLHGTAGPGAGCLVVARPPAPTTQTPAALPQSDRSICYKPFKNTLNTQQISPLFLLAA